MKALVLLTFAVGALALWKSQGMFLPRLRVLNCRACGSQATMRRTSVSKHGSIAGCLGLGIGVFGLLALAVGVVGLNPFGVLLGLLFLAIGGTLNGSRKVWKCRRCGHTLERA